MWRDSGGGVFKKLWRSQRSHFVLPTTMTLNSTLSSNHLIPFGVFKPKTMIRIMLQGRFSHECVLLRKGHSRVFPNLRITHKYRNLLLRKQLSFTYIKLYINIYFYLYINTSINIYINILREREFVFLSVSWVVSFYKVWQGFLLKNKNIVLFCFASNLTILFIISNFQII